MGFTLKVESVVTLVLTRVTMV